MRKASDRIWGCVEPVVLGLGYELVGVEFGGGPGSRVLRVYIDTDDGVTVDDCAAVSEQLSASLDVDDPVNDTYVLEVSSPGIDRPLFREADYRRFAGETVSVRLGQPQEGRRRFRGLLGGVEAEDVLVEVDGTTWRLPLADIDEAHLIGQL